jgi:hypothetical protein
MSLFGQGAAGLPEPAMVDFARLELPRSPNACLGAPPGFPVAGQIETPLYPVPPERLFAVLLALAEGFPRTWLLRAWPGEAGGHAQAQWVERSARLGFPDLVNAAAVPRAGGSGLLIYSRSRIGWSDLGVNRKRVEAWVAGLEMAVR